MRCDRRSPLPVRPRQPATYRSALYSSTRPAPSTRARPSSRTSLPTAADCPPACLALGSPVCCRSIGLGKARLAWQGIGALPSALNIAKRSVAPSCVRQTRATDLNRSTSAEGVGYLAGLGAVVDLVGYVEGQGVGVLVPVGTDRLEVHLRQALVGQEVEVADETVLVVLVRDLDAEEVDDVAGQ